MAFAAAGVARPDDGTELGLQRIQPGFFYGPCGLIQASKSLHYGLRAGTLWRRAGSMPPERSAAR